MRFGAVRLGGRAPESVRAGAAVPFSRAKHFPNPKILFASRRCEPDMAMQRCRAPLIDGFFELILSLYVKNCIALHE